MREMSACALPLRRVFAQEPIPASVDLGDEYEAATGQSIDWLPLGVGAEGAQDALGSFPIAVSPEDALPFRSASDSLPASAERPPAPSAGASMDADGAAEFVIEDSLGEAGSGGASALGRGAAVAEQTVDDVAVIDVTTRRDVFNYLTLCADMIQDHLPDSYTKAVSIVLKKTR
jgi:hypothetical protein